MAAYDLATLGYHRGQSTAAICLVLGRKGRLKVDGGSAPPLRQSGVPCEQLSLRNSLNTDFENLASLADGDGFLLQVFSQQVAYRSSLAKKTDFFFNISTSPRIGQFSCFN